jgi:hypothetical protein
MLYRPVAAPNPTQPPFLDVRFLYGVVFFYIDDANALD